MLIMYNYVYSNYIDYFCSSSTSESYMYVCMCYNYVYSEMTVIV